MFSKGIFVLALLQLFFGSGKGQYIEVVSVITSPMKQQGGAGNNVPSSPCPDAFQYQYSRNGWTGKIAVPPSLALDGNGRMIPVKLNVQLTLPASLPNKYVGKLQLAESEESVWQKLRRRDPNNPILYDVIFPLRHPLPHVNVIRVNRNLLCSGNGGRIPGHRYTLINLDHMFQPYTISGGGGRPVVVDVSQTDDEDEFVVYNFGTSKPGDQPGLIQVRPMKNTTSKPPVVHVQTTTPEVTSVKPTTPAVVHFQQTTTSTTTSSLKPTAISGTCGKPLSTTPLIAFGESVSKRGDWPWVVAVFHNKVEEAGIRFACGGTLISKVFVLTAAHCTVQNNERMDADLFTLYLGKFNLSNWFEAGAQVRAVKYVYWHPDYKAMADADLAILELTTAAEYSSYVQPACMWPYNQLELGPLVGKIGTVVGWGKDENNKILTSTPKLARTPIVSQEDCLRSHFVFSGLTSNRTFCAGYKNGTGPCEGDSGGGFMLPMPDEELGGFKWYLRGVVSTSLGSNVKVKCDLHQYIIYVDVAKHRPWISQFVTV